MTIDGGKPHAVGDLGQRYEVTFFDPAAGCRRVFGWCSSPFGATGMAAAVRAHPSWSKPWITDRDPGTEI